LTRSRKTKLGAEKSTAELRYGRVIRDLPPTKGRVSDELGALLSVLGPDTRRVFDTDTREPEDTGGTQGEVEALPDLPEYEESTRDAEALEELIQLTSRLHRAPFRDDPAHGGGPGLVFGPYRLLEKVAIGGMAEIFRAKRVGVEGFEKTVALKRILPHLSDHKEFVTLFVDEAKTVARLAHQNIVQIFDLGRIHTSYYIAMEFVHGRDLRTVLKRCRERGVTLPVPLALRITSSLCAGLGYAHSKRDERGTPMRIVHRDVSPQNVLLGFSGEIKLTDFGIAKGTHKVAVTERGTLRGKITYMSPEQTWGGALDNRSDLFSLGVMFYEMLTDEKPYAVRKKSDAKLLETVRECKIVPPTSHRASLSKNVERVVLRALQRRPEERYSDAEAMQDDIDAILGDERTATSTDLARFLAQIFTAEERGERPDDDATHPSLQLSPISYKHEAPVPREAMSLERLLDRFSSES
jgi:serine/threonine protein kinase